MNRSATEAKPRGRPRSEEKRREILVAATELFTRAGYESTSIDDIAAAAGVSKQTVYSHFGNKENLFATAVSVRCRQSGLNDEDIDLDVPPEVMLPELARRFVDLVMSPEAMRVSCVCTSSAESHPELGRLFFRHGPQKTKEAVTRYMEAQRDAGNLNIEDPGFAAWQFLSMLRAEAHMREQFGLQEMDSNKQERYIQSCVDLFLSACAPRNGQ